MRWPWSAAGSIAELATPIAELDPATLEVIEVGPGGRALAAWAEDDALRELGYAPHRADPSGTAGIWRALEHS